MTDDSNYSKREQDQFRSTMVDEMNKQTCKLDKILDQTTRHNGRMSKIEDKIEDYPDLKKTVIMLVNFKWWLTGAVAVITLLGGTMLTLIYKNLVTKAELTSTLSKYDQVIINN